MRVGFVTQLLWSRYGGFWHKLVAGAGADPVFAERERVLARLGDPRFADIPGAVFRLAAAEALALSDGVDLIVAPDPNRGSDVPRGGGQDPWVASFPESLATVGGIAPVVAVPARLGTEIEGTAVALVQRLVHEPAVVRRLWDRFRASARPPRVPALRWQLRPSELATVGVVAPPWLLRPALLEALRGDGEHLVGQHQFDPLELIDEGLRADARLVPTDAETLGAARLLGRRGTVDRLRILIDRSSGADAWLVERIRRTVHKPLVVHALQDLLDPDALVDALLAVPDRTP